MRITRLLTIGFLFVISGAFVWQSIASRHEISLLQKQLAVFQDEQQSIRDMVAKLGAFTNPKFQIVSRRDIVGTKTFANVTVECPTGMKILGGGFSIETPNDVKVFSSLPSDGKGNLVDHAWNVMVQNAGLDARQTTAVGICVLAE